MKIGLDIGGSHIAIGVVNEQYELILKEEKEIKISESKNPNETLYNSMIQMIEEIIQKIGQNNLELIGLACPRKYKERKNYQSCQLKCK